MQVIFVIPTLLRLNLLKKQVKFKKLKQTKKNKKNKNNHTIANKSNNLNKKDLLNYVI